MLLTMTQNLLHQRCSQEEKSETLHDSPLSKVESKLRVILRNCPLHIHIFTYQVHLLPSGKGHVIMAFVVLSMPILSFSEKSRLLPHLSSCEAPVLTDEKELYHQSGPLLFS